MTDDSKTERLVSLGYKTLYYQMMRKDLVEVRVNGGGMSQLGQAKKNKEDAHYDMCVSADALLSKGVQP